MAMEDEIIAENPQPSTPQRVSLAQQLKPLVKSPEEDFLVTLMDVADRKDILDKSFGQASVEDRLDLQDQQADPMEFLSREELSELVHKYIAIPEPRRSEIGNELRRQLPPHIAQRLDAVVRFVVGKQ